MLKKMSLLRFSCLRESSSSGAAVCGSYRRTQRDIKDNKHVKLIKQAPIKQKVYQASFPVRCVSFGKKNMKFARPSRKGVKSRSQLAECSFSSQIFTHQCTKRLSSNYCKGRLSPFFARRTWDHSHMSVSKVWTTYDMYRQWINGLECPKVHLSGFEKETNLGIELETPQYYGGPVQDYHHRRTSRPTATTEAVVTGWGALFKYGLGDGLVVHAQKLIGGHA